MTDQLDDRCISETCAMSLHMHTAREISDCAQAQAERVAAGIDQRRHKADTIEELCEWLRRWPHIISGRPELLAEFRKELERLL